MTPKYQRRYDDIIERAKRRVLDIYREKHHILPRSLGGDNDPGNLVDLTYREHFLVHWLLVRIYDGAARWAMLAAFNAMTLPSGDRIISSWQFDAVKRARKNERLRRIHARREQQLRERPQRFEASVIAARLKIVALRKDALTLDVGKDRDQLSSMARDWIVAGRTGYGNCDRMIIKTSGVFPDSKVKVPRRAERYGRFGK
jgi:hypothetical protein